MAEDSFMVLGLKESCGNPVRINVKRFPQSFNRARFNPKLKQTFSHDMLDLESHEMIGRSGKEQGNQVTMNCAA